MPELFYSAPQSLCGVNLTCEQAVQELWKGRSWVLVTNDADPCETVRLNRTPERSFLLMASMTLVEINDVERAMNVAEQVLRGQITLEQVRANYPACRLGK